MLEITIAVCPPEGERRILLTGKIENVTPERESFADYRCEFRCGKQERVVSVCNMNRSHGALRVVKAAVDEFERRFGGLLEGEP